MEKKDPIGFALRRITTEQFAVIEKSYQESKEIELKTNIRFGIDFDKEIVAVLFGVQLEQDVIPFLIVETGCHFSISHNSWNEYMNQEMNELTLPKNFVSHLVMLSIGTTRGVLHSKTEGTQFNKFILPTINVGDFIKDDVVFKKQLQEVRSN